MSTVYLGLGSNVGDKEENIQRAVELIKEKCEVSKQSSLYETEPVGYDNQDWFLNSAMKVKTILAPKELLAFLQSIEQIGGRVKTFKNGPRVIDLDILFYDNQIIKENDLIVPHPRLHERLFVLEPLYEICPDYIHPIFKKSVKELYLSITKEKEVRKL